MLAREQLSMPRQSFSRPKIKDVGTNAGPFTLATAADSLSSTRYVMMSSISASLGTPQCLFMLILGDPSGLFPGWGVGDSVLGPES